MEPAVTFFHSIWESIASTVESIDGTAVWSSLIGAIGGSAGASAVLLLNESRRRQRQSLAEFNAATAILGAHLTILINLKLQFAEPQFQEVRDLQALIDNTQQQPPRGRQGGPVRLELDKCVKLIPPYSDEFLVPFETISQHADKDAGILQLLIQSKEAFQNLRHYISQKNEITEEMRRAREDAASPAEKTEVILCYLNRRPVDGSYDDRLPSLSEAVLTTTDDALFFINKTYLALQDLAPKALPKRLHKNIAKVQIKDPQKRAAIPPNDHLPGW